MCTDGDVTGISEQFLVEKVAKIETQEVIPREKFLLDNEVTL